LQLIAVIVVLQCVMMPVPLTLTQVNTLVFLYLLYCWNVLNCCDVGLSTKRAPL